MDENTTECLAMSPTLSETAALLESLSRLAAKLAGALPALELNAHDPITLAREVRTSW